MEKIIVQDNRIMDLGLLTRLLGEDIKSRIYLAYLSSEVVIESHVKINPDIPVMIINAHESDIDILDNYFDCPFSAKRILARIDEGIYWVYIEK